MKFHHGAEQCPHCNFSISTAQKLFGNSSQHLARINDTSGLIRKSEIDSLSKLFRKLEKKLPPLILGIHITSLDEANTFRQYSFWLLNQAELMPEYFDHRTDLDPAWLALIVLDIRNQNINICAGYQVEKFLPKESFYPILNQARLAILDKNYLKAFSVLARSLTSVIRKTAIQVQKNKNLPA